MLYFLNSLRAYVFPNNNVTITWEPDEDSKEIEIQTDSGKITGNLVYPNRIFSSQKLDGYILSDPSLQIINTESGDRLLSEGSTPKKALTPIVLSLQYKKTK